MTEVVPELEKSYIKNPQKDPNIDLWKKLKKENDKGTLPTEKFGEFMKLDAWVKHMIKHTNFSPKFSDFQEFYKKKITYKEEAQKLKKKGNNISDEGLIRLIQINTWDEYIKDSGELISFEDFLTNMSYFSKGKINISLYSSKAKLATLKVLEKLPFFSSESEKEE